MKRSSGAMIGVCALAGFLLGATLRASYSGAPAPNPRPNVVVLRGEKRITLEEPALTLPRMADAFGKQTGYRFTIGDAFADYQPTVGIIAKDVPLKQCLAATAMLTTGVWEQKGHSYLLRKRTAKDRIAGPDEWRALLDRAKAYLQTVDPNDPSLHPQVAYAVKNTLEEYKSSVEQPLFTPVTMDAWKVKVTDHGISVGYDKTGDGWRQSAVQAVYW